jgi:hypothetical protein
MKYPDEAKKWVTNSNTLALLAVPDEQAMLRMLSEARARGVRVAEFREPDLSNALTAISIEPGPIAKKLCGHLPLALQEY